MSPGGKEDVDEGVDEVYREVLVVVLPNVGSCQGSPTPRNRLLLL